MRKPIVASVMLAAVLAPVVLAKRKDDVVVMKNGDRFTGEIKKLDRGRLHFKADYMADSVQLDWAEVDHLESKDQYNVSLTTGDIHTGLIAKKSDDQPQAASFSVSREETAVRVPREEVAAITPMESSVWNQFTGSIDYGFSFTSGQNVTQSSLSSNLTYRAEKWSFQAMGSSVFNSQTGSADSGRNTFNALYARYLTQKWFAAAVSSLLNSKQQELTLRTAAGGGLGRVLLRSDHTNLLLVSGINFSRERYSEASGRDPQVNNAEALFHLRYGMFRFSNTQVDVDLYAYPNLSNFGRVRTGLQTELRFEIFRNFFWKFSLYENFDSQPPINAPRNDFGTTTSFGWKF